MTKTELLEALQFKSKEADSKLSDLKHQYTQLEKDIEYWEESYKALRTITCRLNIEIHREG